MSSNEIFRIEYDDDVFTIISKINNHIRQYGLSIENIEGEYDGYEVFKIEEK